MHRIDKIIYLAGPYSHRLQRIRRRRHNQSTEVSARLLENGILNFSPITHCHYTQDYMETNDTGFDNWRRNDLAFVSRCEEVWVLMIPGWDKSYGVAEEVKFAKANRVPVRYINVRNDELVVTGSPSKGEVLLVITGDRETL